MAFSDWILYASLGLLAHNVIKKNKEEQALCKIQEDEHNRQDKVAQKRRATPCPFRDGIAYSDFYRFAHSVSNQFKRINRTDIDGPVVSCIVKSQTGISSWIFTVDFNNWGHVDGTYWLWQENSDSSIPKHYANELSAKINALSQERQISIPDFSSAVDNNITLETELGLDTKYREFWLLKLLRKKLTISNINFCSDYLLKEHLYPVISLLRQDGFLNIKAIPIDDVDGLSSHFPFEVEKVTIDGIDHFGYKNLFPKNAEVLIQYHNKRKITFPCSENKLKRRNLQYVIDFLYELGFSNIYSRPINDIMLGLFLKDGTVKNVFIDENGECPVRRGATYLYDTEIIVCYHSRS
ncbi:MAG: hypothetical protein LUC39_00150 [Clostridiales bacterium]|nr:hypothetical protein [Clostridiales bacterium]